MSVGSLSSPQGYGDNYQPTNYRLKMEPDVGARKADSLFPHKRGKRLCKLKVVTEGLCDVDAVAGSLCFRGCRGRTGAWGRP